VKTAESLKRALWGKDLKTVLKCTSEAEGNWKYVPKEQIKSLGMDKIRYREKEGLLIRAEYEAALNAVYSHRTNAIFTKSRGVIIIGQPGIGALFLPIIK
jgi:hypothetical protein